MTSVRPIRLLGLAARLVAAGVALSQLAGAARAARPVTVAREQRAVGADAARRSPSISVVVPARDEAARIGPLLDAVVGAPGVGEVIVVDDQSTDATAAIASGAGASVVDGSPLPAGWAGKAWALQQGIEAAAGEWIVTLDADARPDPRLPAALVDRTITDGIDLLTVGGRFDCPTPGSRWLHPAMLTTLVYRFGPPGVRTPPDRTMANGQCMTFRRAPFLAAGGMGIVAGEVVEDIALARRLAATGSNVGFLDASDLLTVRMFESFDDTWRGWGRSIALPGAEPVGRQLAGLAVVLLAQALPLPRLLLRRADLLDAVLLLARIGTLFGTRTAYTTTDAAYWASPLADLPAAAAIALGVRRRGAQVWRGRTYG